MTDDPTVVSDICAHCGEKIQVQPGGVLGKHLTGDGPGLGRCQNPGKPYGYNAHPIGTPCPYPCMGEVQPDPDLVVALGSETSTTQQRLSE